MYWPGVLPCACLPRYFWGADLKVLVLFSSPQRQWSPHWSLVNQSQRSYFLIYICTCTKRITEVTWEYSFTDYPDFWKVSVDCPCCGVGLNAECGVMLGSGAVLAQLFFS